MLTECAWTHACPQICEEGVVPDLLHVFPVSHNSALDGVIQSEDVPLGLGLMSNVGILLSIYLVLLTGTTHDRWEDSPVGGTFWQKWERKYIRHKRTKID